MTKTDKKHKKNLVLLDAHAILHRAFHALPDFTSPTGEPTGALYGVTTMLLKIIEDFKPDYMAACYDLPKPTYRHEAYAEYKSGRSKTDESLVSQIKRSRDIFRSLGIAVFERPGFEADDLLGTIAHLMKEYEKGVKVIIASGDMDTMQCVDDDRVLVFTLKRGIKDTVLYNEKLVKERFGFGPELIADYKGLRGDPSDNIPGIPGIGDKTATQLITTFGSIDDIYKKLKAENGEKIFLEQGIKSRVINLLKEYEEEAEFSKMLATIRVDALDKFVLSDTLWRDNLNCEKIHNLFSELGFKSIVSRLDDILEIKPKENKNQTDEKIIEEDEVDRVRMYLWLIDSERTHSTYDDIIDYGRSFFGTDDWLEIKENLINSLKKMNLWEWVESVEEPLRKVLRKMTKIGIKLDISYLRKLSKRSHQELTSLETEIHDLANDNFNINSPKQLGEVLFDKLGLKVKRAKKTAGGQRSTRESELQKLKNQHPIIDKILRYRELQKLTSTYIDNLPKLTDENNRLHSTFLQTGTTTGRLSSRDPNLQNIPVRTKEGLEIRRAFIADENCSLVAIDYSQIELRVAAILSGDKKMIEIFKNGEDVHKAVSMQVFGVSEDRVTPDMRRRAKVINFGILYGMGVNSLRQNLGEDITRAEAQEFLNAYFNTFTRLAEYLEESKNYAHQHGYTKTIFGRRRHFPGITSHVPFIRAQAERMAINAPIQGSQADIIRLAMVKIDKYIHDKKLDKKVQLLLQVHDELIFNINNTKLTAVIPELVNIMTGILSEQEARGVPLEVSVKTGVNWRDLKSFNVS